MMKTFPFALVQHWMMNADIPEDSLVRTYSGRSMYGKACFGLVMPDYRPLCRFFAEIGYWLAIEDLADTQGVFAPKKEEYERYVGDLSSSVEVDSMGVDMIVYFPGFGIEDDDNEDGRASDR